MAVDRHGKLDRDAYALAMYIALGYEGVLVGGEELAGGEGFVCPAIRLTHPVTLKCVLFVFLTKENAQQQYERAAELIDDLK